MKTAICVFLIALLANNAVEARRGLTQVTATAVADASDGGDASAVAKASGSEPTSAEAVSVAKGCNADAKTTAVAEDGADIKGTTVAESEDCADVNAETTVVGKGEDADADVTTVLRSAESIDVTVFVKRVQDGEDVDTVAVAIVKEFEAYEYPRVVATLVELADDEATLAIFHACMLELYRVKGCDDYKLVFVGYLNLFVVYEIPEEVATCLYPPCSQFSSAESCCGEAQLAQTECACTGGTCLWEHEEAGAHYWECNECGEEIEICKC